jgi:L-fucose mutarotase
MLINIPSIISPDLLKILMEMGHGDEIILADGNFPAASHANRLVRCDGHGVPDLLAAVLELMPLDTDVEYPVSLMAVPPSAPVKPVIWEEYKSIINASSDQNYEIEMVERFEFYERAKKAFAIVATGETALYANIILKKGVVT